jgi:hypothetical protein
MFLMYISRLEETDLSVAILIFMSAGCRVSFESARLLFIISSQVDKENSNFVNDDDILIQIQVYDEETYCMIACNAVVAKYSDSEQLGQI